jgi:hypothetical protein
LHHDLRIAILTQSAFCRLMIPLNPNFNRGWIMRVLLVDDHMVQRGVCSMPDEEWPALLRSDKTVAIDRAGISEKGGSRPTSSWPPRGRAAAGRLSRP